MIPQIPHLTPPCSDQPCIPLRPCCMPPTLPIDSAHTCRPQAPECVRRQKRRELDARRSKCRIRIGGHLERWCRLKEQLGFALHSQLAQFLLDRYSSHGCAWSPGRCFPPNSMLASSSLGP
ncbi:zinc finger protein 692-like [Cyanistes caeruleus]|uniref:zinc finger protein 692-like n=1 Tax=Cyanistes caeruleus TaxID=156563 RepID=UPI000CDB72B2|nr:zinc finger protein 692-like [Cyanistes caeruleus]